MSRCIRQPSSTRSFRVGPADAQLVEEPLAHLPVVVPARVHQRGAEARRLRHRIHQRGGLHGIGRAPATRMIFILTLPQVHQRLRTPRRPGGAAGRRSPVEFNAELSPRQPAAGPGRQSRAPRRGHQDCHTWRMPRCWLACRLRSRPSGSCPWAVPPRGQKT